MYDPAAAGVFVYVYGLYYPRLERGHMGNVWWNLKTLTKLALLLAAYCSRGTGCDPHRRAQSTLLSGEIMPTLITSKEEMVLMAWALVSVPLPKGVGPRETNWPTSLQPGPTELSHFNVIWPFYDLLETVESQVLWSHGISMTLGGLAVSQRSWEGSSDVSAPGTRPMTHCNNIC